MQIYMNGLELNVFKLYLFYGSLRLFYLHNNNFPDKKYPPCFEPLVNPYILMPGYLGSTIFYSNALSHLYEQILKILFLISYFESLHF